MFFRRLLPLAVLLLLAACAGGTRNLDAPAPEGIGRIVLWNKPSGERIDVNYREDGHYVPSAFAEIDHIFRDRHTGEEYAIDIGLIEVIAGLRDRMVMPPDTPIELLSGYRSPETNAILARTNRYVAKQSYHMKGMAADIRIPDMNSHVLELVAKTIQRGGVALYPDSRHVHVDTGPVRGWEVVPGFEPGLGNPKKAKVEPKKALGKMTVSPAPSPSAHVVRAKPVYSTPGKKPKTPAKAVQTPAKKSQKNAAPVKKASPGAAAAPQQP